MRNLNPKIFLAAYRQAFPKPVLTPQAAEGLPALLTALTQDSEIEDVRWAAYMLATVKHECANAWRPITEHGTDSYFDKYNAGTVLGARLGNTQPGDGFRFRGRGFVQITGRTNYGALGKALHLGTQLLENPEMALKPDVAYGIMSHGMCHGSFTGRRLDQFFNATQTDYLNARKIINSLDQAEKIRDYAIALEKALALATERHTTVAVPAKPASPATAAGVVPVPAVPAVAPIGMAA
jgi:putative chitinase